MTADSRLYTARCNGVLVGYALAVRGMLGKNRRVSWATQLVVHEEYRRQGIAKLLLFSIWRFSTHFARGLLTSNPYAVRALEKATRRRCRPHTIARGADALTSFGRKYIPYFPPVDRPVSNSTESRLNTRFFVDHSTLQHKLASVTKTQPWTLGLHLPEGWEWLAATFRQQKPLELTREELEAMLRVSDDTTREAYSRVQLSPRHLWHRHADAETTFFLDACGVRDGGRVLDFGCGDGRHALAVAWRGHPVIGVDYVETSIRRAQRKALDEGILRAQFVKGDCRRVTLGVEAEAVLCVYDVIGTFVGDNDNLAILRNIRAHLKPGGRALLSVMSREITERLAVHRCSLSRDPNSLLALEASATMETTGEIFDPDHYMIDDDSGIVYRWEQFDVGDSLPDEFLVRDRRFFEREIVDLCQRAGLRVMWTRHVRAGAWSTALEPGQGKEILLLCSR